MTSAGGSDRLSRVLLIERDPEQRRRIAAELLTALAGQPDIVEAESGRTACQALKADGFDVIIADIDSLSDVAPGTDALARLCRLAAGGLIIALSNGISVSSAVAAMQAGAHDYFPKPVSGPAFAERLQELAQRHGKAGAMRIETSTDASDFHGFVGRSTQMQVIYDQIARIAPSPAPVFITGEAGTGKSLCAEALHAEGARADRPLIAVNCTAIPHDRLEGELFGGPLSPNGGSAAQGAAALADGGTLFIDEIDAMDTCLQTRLMRFLQTGTVGLEGAAQAVDVRVICATNRNPMQLISERRFREDLFYRLHVLPIHLPPLRQHPADILPLARHFLEAAAGRTGKDFSGIGTAAADALVSREWHGNVRQLENLVCRIADLFAGGEVSSEMIATADIEGQGIAMSRNRDTGARHGEPAILPMWRQEQRIIEDAVAHFGGNIAQAAAALEISPSTIYRKRQSWEEMAGKPAGAA